MWKIGCGIALVGLLLTVGSCFFFGTAAQKAVAERQVAEIRLEPGASREARSRRVAVDPRQPARVAVETRIEIPDSVVHGERDWSEILQLSLPIQYEVLGESRERIHREAGSAKCSTILPASDSPHLDSFDPTVACSFHGCAFDPPASGNLWIAVDVPDRDDDGHPVRSARLKVFDQLEEGAGRWFAGGVFSLLLGPVILGAGMLLFVIGLFVSSSPKARPPKPPAPPP